jgi:hypothetical protein
MDMHINKESIHTSLSIDEASSWALITPALPVPAFMMSPDILNPSQGRRICKAEGV